jgi:diphthamide synthase (EF-2-diphthine--ammonia ligase)
MPIRDLHSRERMEAREREPVLFCWSGGKDSAMALHALLQRSDICITGLLTTVTEGYERISMHGVRRELLERGGG